MYKATIRATPKDIKTTAHRVSVIPNRRKIVNARKAGRARVSPGKAKARPQQTIASAANHSSDLSRIMFFRYGMT